MSKKEKNLDIFISKLLDSAKIKYSADGSSIKEINDALKTASKKGTGRVGFPEFVGISNEFIIVIENKANLDKQVNYVNEEQAEYAVDIKSLKNFAENGAYHYGKHIVENTNFKKVFAFGCSGDEIHHVIRPIFIDESGYKLLQQVENFENFAEDNIEKYYKEQVLGETPPEILETEELIRQSSVLHEALRNYGQLGDKEKPLVVSAILLALSDKNFKVGDLNGDDVKTDGQKIFDAVESYMQRVKVTPQTKKDKVLRQFNIIRDRTLLNEVDKRIPNKEEELAKTPLKYFTEFIHSKILTSITANVKEDVLGNFYGEFMKYSGGDGKSLGVVLTPPHITELFCDIAELKTSDIILDPCCGTAGFLISAMHRMENMAETEEEKKHIKSNQLHGIEIREDMFSIATTNMILRDDGKSQLVPGNFLAMDAKDLRKKKYTVGFINPPYSQAKGKDTTHLSEIHFIEHLLNSLDDNAVCIAIVPQSTMVGKSKADKEVKKRILKKHSLQGVITLNKETFYRIGVNPCMAVFTAHKPHDAKERVKFFNFEDDGFVINKHIGPVKTERAKERKVKLLDCWFDRDDAETKFMVKTTIEPTDEWLHSFYYFNDEIPKAEDFENTIADYLTFEFNMIMQGRGYLFENAK